jgi:hypothetical protein
MNAIKEAYTEGIDRYLARRLHEMIIAKDKFPLMFSAFMLFIVTAPFMFMPIWYQVIGCVVILIALGRVAWLAGKMKNDKV